MKRKIAAILAADIAGYSKLVSEDEEETVRRLASYRGTFDDFVSQKGGRIFNTAGDAVLAEFPSAVEALRCAVDIQESVRTRNMAYPASRQMVFRIGISIGDVVERDGDLLGDGVNVAARLQALAKPGGICVARSVYEQVANKLSLTFADVGPQNLKNIATPVHAYFVAMPSADAERPAPRRSANIWTGAGLLGVAALLVAVAIGLKQRAPSPGLAHIETRVGTSAPLPQETAAAARVTTVTGSERAPIATPDVEFSTWNAVRDDDDPQTVQRYLDRFPDGQFAFLARQRIAALHEQQAAALASRAGMDVATAEPEQVAEPLIIARPAPPQAVVASSAHGGSTSAASTPPSEKSELARSLQQQLKRVGCFDAEADGTWGQKSRTALRDFARFAKLSLHGDEPDVSLLDAAAAAKSRVCPLVCDDGEVVRNGRCASKPRAPRAREAASSRPRARAERPPQRSYEEGPKSSGAKLCFGPVRNELVACK